jgi:hypothetical protein
MLIPAIAHLAHAALIGSYHASKVLSGKLPPWPAAIFHGLFAAIGLVLVVYSALTETQPPAVLAGAGLLVVAALGGFVMISFHLR